MLAVMAMTQDTIVSPNPMNASFSHILRGRGSDNYESQIAITFSNETQIV